MKFGTTPEPCTLCILMHLLFTFASCTGTFQACENNSPVKGRFYKGFTINNLNTIGTNETVLNIFDCDQLCKSLNGCFAVSYDVKTKICKSYSDQKEAISKMKPRDGSYAVIYVPSYCEAGEKGVWTEWVNVHENVFNETSYRCYKRMRRSCHESQEGCNDDVCDGASEKLMELQATGDTITSEPICFTATSHNSPARFLFDRATGTYEIRLIHMGGGVGCFAFAPISPFGCIPPGGIFIMIRNELQHTIVDSSEFTKVDVSGNTPTSIQSKKVTLTFNQSYEIWYKDALNPLSVLDNSGQSCVDVEVYRDTKELCAA